MKFTKAEFITALRTAGVCPSDLVMVHTGMSSLRAIPEGVKSQDELSAFCVDGLREVLGERGTICVPSFSYSLGSGEVFDAHTTPTQGIGEFPEYFWKLPGVLRSNDPFLAVAAQGPLAAELLKERAQTSYGYGSFFDMFVQAGGKLVTIGVGMRWATIRYHFTEIAGAPFRYLKKFKGLRRIDGRLEPVVWEYSVAPRAEKSDKISRQLGFVVEDMLAEESKVQRAPLGRGFISCIGARQYRDFIIEILKRNPWISGEEIKSTEEIVAEEEQRSPKVAIDVSLKTSDIDELARKLTPLPRYCVSDGYDAALYALQKQFPLSVESVPTGTRLAGWVVPERWTCRGAEVKTSDGKSVFSYAASPLCVMEYTRAFSGTVSRAELLAHLYSASAAQILCEPEAIPYIRNDISQNWQICCSLQQQQLLTETSYQVEIDADFSYGKAKVGEWRLPGKSERTILLVAYLDTPYQMNAGLSGVIAGLQVMERLRQKENRKFSYQFVILPYRMGVAGWSSLHHEQTEKIIGGIAMDALAIPDGVQIVHYSEQGDAFLDQCCDRFVAANGNPQIIQSVQIVDTETAHFLGNGYGLPMLFLRQQQKLGNILMPGAVWHTDMDTWEQVDLGNLERSVDWLLQFLASVETKANDEKK